MANPETLAGDLRAWVVAGGDDAVARTVAAMAAAGIEVADLVAREPLAQGKEDAGGENASGDHQTALDVAAEAVVVRHLAGLPVRAVGSEESAAAIALDPAGTLVLAVDPIDGSSNIDINGPGGTLFAILPAGPPGEDPAAALLQPGTLQLAAGFVLYGPSTVLVLTLRDGTHAYALDRSTGEYVLTHRGIRLPAEAREYAINASNARHWDDGVRTYVQDLVSGSIGPRGKDFNMRWLAALVAEAYRIFLRGGIYLYPADARPGYASGRLRLVYEANPIALLCEQAGGEATDGTHRILELTPDSLHQRTPLVFGSAAKVARVRRYLEHPPTAPEQSPLFNQRGLFR